MQLFNVVKVVCVKWWSACKDFQYNVVVNKYMYAEDHGVNLLRLSPDSLHIHVIQLQACP